MSRVLRLLFVDAHPDAAESYAELARLWGHEACACSDTGGALALAGGRPFDAAVIEPGLAGRGAALAASPRALPGTAKALLVAVGGTAATTQDVPAESGGFDVLLRKPCHPELLRALLEATPDSPDRSVVVPTPEVAPVAG